VLRRDGHRGTFVLPNGLGCTVTEALVAQHKLPAPQRRDFDRPAA
jgi:hypothetical protein